MKKNLLLLTLIAASLQSCNQLQSGGSFADALTLDSAQFTQIHAQYKEPALQHRRFKHSDVDSLVSLHKQRGLLAVEQIGSSVEQRSIYKLNFGAGPKKVMLWSQMHGDEPTATMALFDLFNFLEGKADGFDAVRKVLNDNLSLHFIPMLNPDGAERYSRRNAQSIDLNRDARKGHTVEGSLLQRMAKEIKPQFGFNLHDQNIYYNVPETKNPVSISLLAPAYNQEREINTVRQGAMQLIVGMNKLLQQYIPDGVAKYDDTYSPRGFGDNFQSWGASTVLIESGGKKGDPEKQEIRKLNFVIILNALLEIAQDSYKQYDVKGYEDIPFNASQMHDVLIRNLEIGGDSQSLKTDIAIRRNEITQGRDYFVRGHVEDLGDLDDFYGYDDLDAQGLSFVSGKTYPQEIDTLSQLSVEQALGLLKQGFIAVKLKKITENRLHNLPLVVFTQQEFQSTTGFSLFGSCNFFLAQGATLKYAVVNGYLIDLSAASTAEQWKNRIQ